MRIRDIAMMLAGSIGVFIACSASVVDDGPSNGGKDAGVIADAIEALKDSLGIDITPAKDANAGPLPPTTTTVPCDKSWAPYPSSPTAVYYYAEVAVTGRSKESLAGTTAIVCDQPGMIFPAGYSCSTYTTSIRDGAVAVICGSTGTGGPAKASAVTFVIPAP